MRKNLVIGVVGDKSLHKHWIDDENRNYDLMLIYYGKEKEKYKEDCEYYIENVSGTKWNIIYDLKIQIKELFEKYDYFFFPDDDLIMNTSSINRFFEIASEYKLSLCQPGIVGYISVPFTIPRPLTKIRFTNWVEIMCPCFSSEALKLCWKTFNLNKSNWGIAFVWNLLLEKPKDKIAIIDEIAAIHTRAIGSGENYKNNLAQKEALEELSIIIKKYQINTEKIVYSLKCLDLCEFDNLTNVEKTFPFNYRNFKF